MEIDKLINTFVKQMSGFDRTYGATSAAITLAKLVNNDKRMISRVGKTITDFTLALKEFSKVDRKFRFKVSDLYFDKIKNDINLLPHDSNTYLINVMTGRYRQWKKDNK